MKNVHFPIERDDLKKKACVNEGEGRKASILSSSADRLIPSTEAGIYLCYAGMEKGP